MSTNETNVERQQSETTAKIVYSKLNFSWYLAGTYLDIMRGIGCFSSDKKFCGLFNELRDYVDKQLTKHCQGDINDIFVIAEQIVPSVNIK